MTTEREKYFATMGPKEVNLRGKIFLAKRLIKQAKSVLQGKDDLLEKWVSRNEIQLWKIQLSVLRHELNRLKGMNNVVVPRQVRMATYPASHGFGFGYECVAIGLCACGAPLRDDECKYCQKCGKRVLWKKVK